MKSKTYEDVFDIEGWDRQLEAIRKQGYADLATGKTVSLRTQYDFALRFAEMSDQAERGKFFALGAIRKLRDSLTNPQMVEALTAVVFLGENGRELSEAMSFRPAVFSRELIAAVKAGENDGNYAKHLLNFVKYRELLGTMHEKYRNRDYKGLRDSLLNP